jgi:hypothetical protein
VEIGGGRVAVEDASGGLKVIRWLVTVRARNLGYACEEVSPEVLAVTGSDGERQDVPLEALRRAATALPRSEWLAAVNEYLDRTLARTAPDDGLDPIRPLLRTKLIVEKAARERSVVSGEFGQDLVEGLVLDGALTMEWVSEERAARWPAEEHELLWQGRRNVRSAGRLEPSTVDVNGTPVTVLTGDDYASTHLFWLDEYGLVGKHGTLVSVPTRTTVLAAPIVAGTTGFDHLDAMVRLTITMYENAEHPLMARIYHWDPDVMEGLDQVLGAALLQPTGHGLNVIVNPAFQESQEALAP